MKTRIYVSMAFLLLICNTTISKEVNDNGFHSTTESVAINVSPDIYGLLEDWTNAYQRQNSTVHFNLNKTTQANLSDVLNSGESLFVSGNYVSGIRANSLWSLTLARNVVVPVMAENNSDITRILSKGIPERDLVQALKHSEAVDNKNKLLFSCFAVDDPIVNSVVKTLNANNTADYGSIITGSLEEVITLLQKNQQAIALCNLAQITDYESKSLKYGLKLVPLDRNANGKLDYMEDIYQNLQAFNRGVWLGKYPKVFTSGIYAVSAQKPASKAEADFMKWVLTTGQQIVIDKGYGDLSYNEQLAQLAKFDEPEKLAQVQVNKANNLMSVLLLIIAFIVFGGALVELAFVRFTRKPVARNKSVVTPTGAFDENSVEVPLGVYFDKSHSWAFMRKNGLVKVGVDDFLQHITGIITRVEMRSIGEKIRKGDRLLSINQKGKQIHIYSPVSGTITEVNEKLKTTSTLINTNPYSEGWVYSIEPLNWNLEIRYLEIAENFKLGLAEEFQRLKEFFASALKPGSPDVAHAILQDGGSLIDHPLTELGPDIWDDFQTKFIDASK